MKKYIFLFIIISVLIFSSCSSNRRVVRALTPYEIVTLQAHPSSQTSINNNVYLEAQAQAQEQSQNTQTNTTTNNSSSTEQTVVVETVTDKPADNNEMLEKKVNDIWEIRLDENPTTGFAWSYKVIGDSNSIDVLDDSFIPPQYDNQVGVPGVHRWYFKAKGKGIVTLAFSYSRSFQEGSEISRRVYTYIISE